MLIRVAVSNNPIFCNVHFLHHAVGGSEVHSRPSLLSHDLDMIWDNIRVVKMP